MKRPLKIVTRSIQKLFISLNGIDQRSVLKPVALLLEYLHVPRTSLSKVTGIWYLRHSAVVEFFLVFCCSVFDYVNHLLCFV